MSPRVRALPVALALLSCTLLLACPEGDGGEQAPAADPRLEKCPKIHLDRMAGQWIKVQGSAADHTHRFELTAAPGTAEGGEVGAYTMWYTGGGFEKRTLEGTRRDSDFKFTEQATGKRKAAFEAGDGSITRLYVEPRLDKCALRISVVDVVMKDGKEVERGKPGFVEYLPFPEGQTLTFRPCTGDLFIGKAASDRALADKQREEQGGADPNHSLGEAIPVGGWSDAAADGDAACTYDMDLYFDDRPVEGQTALAAGEVKDGQRHWSVPAWNAPYSGNHHFQIYRYKTCAGAARELVGVSCLEAVLH